MTFDCALELKHACPVLCQGSRSRFPFETWSRVGPASVPPNHRPTTHHLSPSTRQSPPPPPRPHHPDPAHRKSSASTTGVVLLLECAIPSRAHISCCGRPARKTPSASLRALPLSRPASGARLPPAYEPSPTTYNLLDGLYVGSQRETATPRLYRKILTCISAL